MFSLRDIGIEINYNGMKSIFRRLFGTFQSIPHGIIMIMDRNGIRPIELKKGNINHFMHGSHYGPILDMMMTMTRVFIIAIIGVMMFII